MHGIETRTSDQVARHEDHGELIVVLVIAPPDGVILLVKLVEEVGDGFLLVIVGIEPLEVVHVEVALGESCEGILLLLFAGELEGVGGCSDGGGLLFGGLLLGLLLLDLLVVVAASFELGLDDLLTQLDASNHGLEVGLVDQSLEPAGHVGEGFSVVGLEDVLVRQDEGAGHADVGQADPLADKEGGVEQVVVQEVEGLLQVFLGLVAGVLVGGHHSHDLEHPSAGGGQEFGVGVAQPLLNLSLGDGVLAAELVIGHKSGDGVALK